MINKMFSSDVKDIKQVKDINYRLEDNEIIFIANCIMNGNYDSYYKIGRYDLTNGYGNIITSKGIKEYSNLKSLCKATEKFNPLITFEYNKVLEIKKEYKNEIKKSI